MATPPAEPTPAGAGHHRHGAVELSDRDRALLEGEAGAGPAMAMGLVVRLAEAMGARALRSVVGAHIDSCLYHGRSGLDFVERLVEGGAEVTIPTTLNVSSLDLLHPELYRGDPETGRLARRLMDRYVDLGCVATWTCAPYQRDDRPAFGQHVAWAESNAIVFANSVLGARTHRYGDFIDIAAAITGRVPDAGLHRDEHRRADRVIDVTGLPDRFLAGRAAYPVLGHLIGRWCSEPLATSEVRGRPPAPGSSPTGSSPDSAPTWSPTGVPAIVGLPGDASEDDLKALGASAASSGSVALFHAVGRTPEAPTLEAATGGFEPAVVHTVTMDQCRATRDLLSAAVEADLATVSLGTPHYSIREIGELVAALGERRVHPGVDLYVSTGREVLAEAGLRGWVERLEAAGVTFVTDTCTYITPIVRNTTGPAMTDSGKWAYYAPANIGVEAVFGSLAECVDSAVAGRVVRDRGYWGGD